MNDRDFASYRDENTPYVTGKNIKEVVQWLENDSLKLFQWFRENQTKANKDKFHFLKQKHTSVRLPLLQNYSLS